MTTDTKAPSLREALEHVRDFIDGKVSTSPDEICAVIIAALEATPPAPTPSAARERIAAYLAATDVFHLYYGGLAARMDGANNHSDAILALLPDAAAIRAAVFEEAAKIIEPKRPRPCDCERCNCGNYGDAEAVAAWDAENVAAAAIRNAGRTG